MVAYGAGAVGLILEGTLALLAFGGNTSKWPADASSFPARTQKLYNENFLSIPVVA